MLLFVVHSTFVTPAEAASGINKQINFQGKLVDNNGLNVADSTYPVVFSLYNVSSGGSAAWTESDSVTTSNGVFQVALGAVTAFPGNVDFNSDTWYLGIKVGSDLEMTPRVRFSAVPYAFNAATLDGIVATNSASQFTITGGTNALIDLTVNGSLTLGSTIKPTAAGGLTLDTNGANALGIGTSANSITFGATNNPSYSFNGTGAFTIAGGGNNNITFGSNGGTGTVIIQPNAGGQAALIVDDKGSGDIFTASASGNRKFVIDKNGRVGIQNANLTPQALLDIGTNGDGINAIQADGGNFVIDQYGHVSALAFNYSSNSNWFSDYQNAQHSFDGYFKLNNTSNPAASLDIISASGFNGNFSFGTLPVAQIVGNTSNAALVVDNPGSGSLLTASVSGATKFIVSNAGTVTIASGQSYTGAGAVTLSSGGSSGLTLDSASGRVSVATGDFFNSGLAGVSGAISGDIWYDTTAQKFKINENGVTKTLCNLTDTGCGTGGAVTLQAAYNGGQTIDLSTTGTGLTIGTNVGTQNIVFAPNAGGQAGLVINDQGSGDIFTASASGSTKLVLSHAGNVGIGSNSPQQALTLGSSSNFVTEMAAPSGVTAGAPTSGGTLTKNTPVFYKVTATDGVGETVGSAESNSCTPAGSTQTCPISWTAVPNAVTYKIYRTTTSGVYTGSAFVTSVTSTSYSDAGVTLTAGTPPTATTAYYAKISGTGASWLLGASLGIGTTTPLAPLDIEDGNGGGNAALIVDQIGASTNDILTGSASGATKFIVHNDGSIQTAGNNATADITTITAGNGLTILPKANSAGAGGGLTLKGGNGTGAAGGNITIDAGTGSTNGTISIGTTNQSGLTIGRSGAATTINGSSVVLGAATSISGTGTITSNSATAFTVGANGSTNPVLTVNASTGSVVTGLQVLGAATGGTTALTVTDSGSAANLSIDAKGTGTITIGGTSSGNVTIGGGSGASTIVIGGATNGLTFSTSSGPSYAGTGRPTKKIVLSAEYPGAVLTASASAAITGNMTSDASPSAITNVPGSIPTTFSYENYYQWTATSLGADQRYTVAVRVTLPKDFSAWVTGTNPYALTIDFNTAFTNAALNSLDVYIYQYGDTSSKPIAFRTAQASGTSKNWTQVTIPSTDLTGGTVTWDSSHPSAIILLTMHSTNSVNYVQVGDITLNYLAAF